MRCDKTSDNHLHERTLKTVYNNNVSTLEKLLEKDNFVTVHVRTLRILAIKQCKTKENLAASIMHEVFEKRNIQYNLRSQTVFQLVLVKTVNCGFTALRYIQKHQKIWNIFPLKIKKVKDS